ncbi:hypothetical protein GXW77_03085 [Roseomonas alkaliterrae]|uniref:DUF2306 domain-containing protein n=1 Tax=Neoroseomonas alkaliterrae TaxID=1452450 RepID=A0A840XMP4_9PROT|nr:hypothetical protein [Neoroseomonas alkaliterrae]MBB5689848.1 hypothetical protein [Neoroseomonas alkaliterrae]MBR0675152.1 hypothetical protein [Neoroseomonas alkaliterrae]
MELHLFHALIALHIVTGATGAIAFWVPVLGRKGGPAHRRWGRLFNRCMVATGCLAMAMAMLTLIAPMATHPHLEGRFDPDFIRGIFGWMMLTTALLTVNLAWYGWLAVLNKRAGHARNRTPLNMALQHVLLVASVNCAAQGWLIGQPLMHGVAGIGIATAVTNLRFLRSEAPGPTYWLKEHVKALVGAGISVYTAFMAFGSVRILPELALHPVMWALPCATGIAVILWHWRAVDRQYAARRPAPA